MTKLKTALFDRIEAARPRATRLNKEFGNVVIDQVTIGQALGGARDVKCLVTDISYLDPQEGIRIRGKNIPETFACLPKNAGAEYPTVEAFWYFILTGEAPDADAVEEIEADFKYRAKVPPYVFDVIRALPKDTHPMVMLSTAVLSMQRESKFTHFYHHGFKKDRASAHTTHLVGSTLSDAYYALGAGLCALAGPLHGLANQEVLDWIQKFREKLGGAEPTEDNVKAALWDTLNSGQVIPGYGHAVLRRTDPRFEAQFQFAEKHLPDDPLFKLVKTIYKVAPGVLTEQGKTKNPWPNVDAASGMIQWHYGLREYDFYTVLFGVGRAIGVLANLVWDRALGYPLERPKSVTTDMLEHWAAGGAKE